MRIEGKNYKTIWFDQNSKNVKIIDQTKLPHEFIIKDLETVDDAINAIKVMEVRGAPLIGATAAFGIVLAIKENNDLNFIKKSAEDLVKARPTAINLQWAVHRMNNKISMIKSENLFDVALKEAELICGEDETFCEEIGKNGLKLIEEIYNKKKSTINILTHCNAGWLATINWGTATSPIYHAHKKGIPIHIWVDETRPRNQGANLTSYELNEEEIPNTIIADNTGGILMQRGQVDMCIVGTDRTLSNGDALPSSTIDWKLKNSKDIPIEERNPNELSHVDGMIGDKKVDGIQIYPKKSKALNLAFDVTPAKYVTALITERGICEASEDGLKRLFK